MEKTKVYDQIYVKHGLKFAAIMSGVDKYNLRQDQDVKECVEAHTAKVQQISKEANADKLLSDDEVKEVVELCQSWGNVVNEHNPDQFLLFKHFKEMQRVIMEYSLRKYN